MSFASAFAELSFPLLSLGEFLYAAGMLLLMAGLCLFFRPLLNGLRRALVLAVRARLTRRAPARRGGGALPGQRA